VSVRDIPREFRDVPYGLIDAPALPSRTAMDETLMDELVESVRQHGILQPLVLARTGERFEVVAGHRRSIAAGRAGLVTVPAIVYPSVVTALTAIQYAENRHREDLNAADEAILFSELLERDCAGDVDRLCAQLGEKRTYVENRLLLFHGDEEIFRQLQAGKIPIGVAQQLNRCTEQQYRRYLLHQAIVGGATVAVVSGWIADWKQQLPPASGEPVGQASAPAPGAIPITNYFVCVCCGGTDNVHLMQPVNVHQHCRLAILDKALEQWQHRGESLRYPRTTDEAVALITELLDRFPQIAPDEATRNDARRV
jgi:ParB/RepB/Spo0J family partition protein